jgi:hypothetical protein
VLEITFRTPCMELVGEVRQVIPKKYNHHSLGARADHPTKSEETLLKELCAKMLKECPDASLKGWRIIPRRPFTLRIV